MTRARVVPVLLLVTALAALGASVAWAVSRDSGWQIGASHSMRGGWMMGYAGNGRAARVKSLEDARAKAQSFADRLGLKTDEVLQFKRNYYVKLVDSHGSGATEVLVDPPTGVVSLEYGPAMMWNTRYGMMLGRGGMMSGAVTQPATTPPSSIDDARVIAQQWLDANRQGIRAESGGDRFPGYYTFETLRDGRIDGMISVNATTGGVWPHWWHGAFVREA